MPDDDIDYGKAIWDLSEAANELRKSRSESKEESVRANSPYCSFCGKGKNEVQGMVRGPSVYICTECVEAAAKLIRSKDS